MNKIVIPAIVAIVAIASGLTLTLVGESTETSTYTYIPSDISKANPNINMGHGSASMDTLKPEEVKERISHTVMGQVVSVDDPIDWTDEHERISGAVPVTIQVTDNIKGDAEKSITFYLHGKYFGDEFYLAPYEAQVEIGEKVLVHLAPESVFEFQDGEALYSPLGEFSKYKIGEDGKAYNSNYKQGKNLDSAMNESK